MEVAPGQYQRSLLRVQDKYRASGDEIHDKKSAQSESITTRYQAERAALEDKKTEEIAHVLSIASTDSASAVEARYADRLEGSRAREQGERKALDQKYGEADAQREASRKAELRDIQRGVRDSIGVIGAESEELGYRIKHMGPQAERSGIASRGRRTEEKFRRENDPRLPFQVSLDEQQLEYFDVQEADHRAKIKLGLDTTGSVTAALLNRDPTGAKVAGQVGSGLGQAKDLQNAGYKDFALQSLQNSLAGLQLTEQNYKDQFHSVGISKFDDITSPRDVENPTAIFKEIADGQQKIVTAINDLKSD